jgi:hypothetical protein
MAEPAVGGPNRRGRLPVPIGRAVMAVDPDEMERLTPLLDKITQAIRAARAAAITDGAVLFGVAFIGGGVACMADGDVLAGGAVITMGVASVAGAVAAIGPAAVVSRARRLTESVTKAPLESEGPDTDETAPAD